MKRFKKVGIFVLVLTIIFSALAGIIAYAAEAKSYLDIYYGENVYSDVYNRLVQLNKENVDISNIFVVGNTVDSRDLLIFKIGNGSKKIFINGEHHAREYITTILTLNQIEYILSAYKYDKKIGSCNIRELLGEVTLYFMPMVNPDGLELCTGSVSKIKNENIKKWIPNKNNYGSLKDNLRGVNLNRNYGEDWAIAKDTKKNPFADGYPGKNAFSELETQAIKKLCNLYKFDGSISYHAAGEIIYWYYFQHNIDRDYSIAQKISKLTGYRLVSIEESGEDISKGGGFKDWFLNWYQKPSLTLEVGKGAINGPMDFINYQRIWNQNKAVVTEFAHLIDTTFDDKRDDNFKLIADNVLVNKEGEVLVTPNSNGQLLYRAKTVLNMLGIKYSWDKQAKEVVLIAENGTARVKLDSKEAVVNGKKVELGNQVVSLNGNAYIPRELIDMIVPNKINEYPNVSEVYIVKREYKELKTVNQEVYN